MKIWNARKAITAIAVIGMIATSACSTTQVVDNTVGAAAGTVKLGAKGVIGVGKLAVRGTGAAIDYATGAE